MTSSNRKLTVAYGTFSCTIEGFDDPIGALAEVAESLSEIAARDPHFGAVPPPPVPRSAAEPRMPAQPAAHVPVAEGSPPADRGPTPWTDAGPEPAPPPARRGATSARARRSAAPDPDLERLFAATDSRLTDEDASRRNATISHLKAAAATRQADPDPLQGVVDGAGAWREDLARAVRPSPHDRTIEGRAASAAGTPLVLVSAQRVPREAAPASFPEVVARSGARGPEAVLALATEHLSAMTGSERFTRARLLAVAAEVPDGADREAAAIAFGRMLRSGRLRREADGLYSRGLDGTGAG